MEIHEDFKRGFERDKHNHDPFELVTMAPLLLAFQGVEPFAMVIEPVVHQLEPLLDELVIHGS